MSKRGVESGRMFWPMRVRVVLLADVFFHLYPRVFTCPTEDMISITQLLIVQASYYEQARASGPAVLERMRVGRYYDYTQRGIISVASH